MGERRLRRVDTVQDGWGDAEGHRQTRTVVVRSLHVGWAGMEALLDEMPGLHVVGVTDHADEALRYVRMYRPGLITMTCTPQGLPAGTLVRAIRRTSTTTKVVVMGDEVDRELLEAPIEEGPHGYLLWQEATTAGIRDALRAVLAGHYVASARIVQERTSLIEQRQHPSYDGPSLSEQERVVGSALNRGLTQVEIARLKHMSLRTVERVVRHLKGKLRVETMGALMTRLGELDLDE